MDEPSIGLHQRDNDKLLNTLRNLKDMGNTLIVVEHDEDTMFAADYIVDIGPGAVPRRRSSSGGQCGRDHEGGRIRNGTVSFRKAADPCAEKTENRRENW